MKTSKRILTVLFLVLVGLSAQTPAQTVSPKLYQAIRNENFTIQALRLIHGAQATHQATVGNGSYAILQQLAAENLIDSTLASGSKYGYLFVVTTRDFVPGTPAAFQVFATPRHYRKTGLRSFYINENGVIRGADKAGAPANQNDPPLSELQNCDSEADCENKAISTLRNLYSAEAAYQSTTGNNNFGSLCQLGQAGLINEILVSGSEFGYHFIVTHRERTSNQPATFEALAIPKRYPTTGRRSFYIDTTGVIRAADKNGAPANADAPPLEY